MVTYGSLLRARGSQCIAGTYSSITKGSSMPTLCLLSTDSTSYILLKFLCVSTDKYYLLPGTCFASSSWRRWCWLELKKCTEYWRIEYWRKSFHLHLRHYSWGNWIYTYKRRPLYLKNNVDYNQKTTMRNLMKNEAPEVEDWIEVINDIYIYMRWKS